MTHSELQEVVNQRVADPSVLGCLTCNLFSSKSLQQRNVDQRMFSMEWQSLGDIWRCTVTSSPDEMRLAQIEIQDDTTTRIELFEPCQVTISREENILCIIRYSSKLAPGGGRRVSGTS